MDYERQIRGTIREFVIDNFLYMQRELPFGDDDPLLRLGIIDSLGIMEVIVFVEEGWNISVDPAAITEANFGSITAIARFLADQVASANREASAA